MKKKTVVLYSGVGVGHLAPMLELARELLRHGSGGGVFDIAVALVEPPVSYPGFPAAVTRVKATYTFVAFHILPPPIGPDADGEEHEHHMARRIRFLRAMNVPLRNFLRSLSSVPALVMFCGDVLDVAAELGLPAYFFSAGRADLAVFLGLPGLRAGLETGLRGLSGGAVLSFAGAPPFRVVAGGELLGPVRCGEEEGTLRQGPQRINKF